MVKDVVHKRKRFSLPWAAGGSGDSGEGQWFYTLRVRAFFATRKCFKKIFFGLSRRWTLRMLKLPGGATHGNFDFGFDFIGFCKEVCYRVFPHATRVVEEVFGGSQTTRVKQVVCFTLGCLTTRRKRWC